MPSTKETTLSQKDKRAWGLNINWTTRQATAKTQIGDKMTEKLIRLKDIEDKMSPADLKVVYNYLIAIQELQLDCKADAMTFIIPGNPFDSLDVEFFDPDPKHMANYPPKRR